MKLHIVLILLCVAIEQIDSAEFSATGPTKITQLSSNQFVGAVKVSFDLHPQISMSFDLPWHFCMVTETGIKSANFAAETYDPVNFDGTGANASFEPGMDENCRFVRVWINQATPARIVVRVRYGLVNGKLEFAHSQFETKNPDNGGKGDWAEEWFYIYPDATYVRHQKIHTGLASISRPFDQNFREPPRGIHEFMESVVIGKKDRNCTDDIHTSPALTVFKLFENNGEVISKGRMKQFNYKLPAGPPRDFGDFRDANIMLINLKSNYKPFTIGLPNGVKISPYQWENKLIKNPYPFEQWRNSEYNGTIGYIAPIGHMINESHFRKTESEIEQVYMHGLVDSSSEDPQSNLVRMAWSWIVPPELVRPGDIQNKSSESYGKYNAFTYSQSQRAYIYPRTTKGPEAIAFSLIANYNDESLSGTMWLVNPTIIIPDWNDVNTLINITVNGVRLHPNIDYRFGHESGGDLVVWINKTYDLTSIEEHKIQILISPTK